MTNTSLSVEKKGVSSVEGGENDGDWMLRPDHPLRNHVILEILFEHVRAKKDLKECRVVCKKWNVATIPFMRSIFTVTIYGKQNQLKKYIRHRHRPNGDYPLIDQFVQVFSKNSHGIPFDNFELGAFGTTDGVGKEFLKLCGETAKKIDFHFFESDSNELFMIEDLSDVLKSSPNLQSLVLPTFMSSKSGKRVQLFPADGAKPTLSDLKRLELSNICREGRNECCPSFIEELLEVAPNISHISTSDQCESIVESENSVGDVLAAIDKLGRESSIEVLSFLYVTKEHVETMQKLAKKPNGLKLKELLSNAGDATDEDFTSTHLQLVTSLKDSLENLCMYQTKFTNFFVFPKMPRLKSLTISISEDFDSKGVDLNKIFPTLETLSITSWQDVESIFNEFFSESEPCPTVKSLDFSSDLNMSLNAFNHTLIVFPKLTTLKLYVWEAEVFQRIWTQMIQLESLTIWFDEVVLGIESLDSVFTGIPFQTLRRIKRDSQIFEKLSPQLRMEIISDWKIRLCQGPSIWNLTNLKYLDLAVWTEEDEEYDLSDLTVYFGLYLMPNLECFTVVGTKITQACLDILKADNNVTAGIKPCHPTL